MSYNPEFKILEKIGEGQFSQVYRARWINAPISLVASHHEHQPPIVNPRHSLPNSRRPSLEASMMLNGASTSTCAGAGTSSHQQTTLIATNGFQNEQTQKHCQADMILGEKDVALKRIKFCDIPNSRERTDLFKEVQLLQQLKHPNIINYSISFVEGNELYIVLELADGGDLSKLIRYFQRKNELLTERSITKYYIQICSAVKYIHSKRILHRDIKPANIFMTSDGCVKLGDFGHGRFFGQNTRAAHSIVGTFYYMSPERIQESGYSFSSDIWSLGCILYELITLHSPFSIILNHQHATQVQRQQQEQARMNGDQQRQQPTNQQQQEQQNPYNLQWLIDRIMRAEYPSLDAYTNISMKLRQLAVHCLKPNPDDRPGMDYMCAAVEEAYRLQRMQIRS